MWILTASNWSPELDLRASTARADGSLPEVGLVTQVRRVLRMLWTVQYIQYPPETSGEHMKRAICMLRAHSGRPFETMRSRQEYGDDAEQWDFTNRFFPLAGIRDGLCSLFYVTRAEGAQLGTGSPAERPAAWMDQAFAALVGAGTAPIHQCNSGDRRQSELSRRYAGPDERCSARSWVTGQGERCGGRTLAASLIAT
ncbi:hypothetical protein VTH06DRAFT_175 [Thermothelomyces fergusii]